MCEATLLDGNAELRIGSQQSCPRIHPQFSAMMVGATARTWLSACGIFSVLAFAHAEVDRAGTQFSISTSFGVVGARVIGTGETTVVALHGMSQAPAVIGEWDRVAAALGERPGYRVVLPNLHSNRRTSPRSISSDEEIEQLCRELLQSVSPRSPVILMGKSWGGGVAARCASVLPGRVRSLVLVAPAVADETTARLLTMPTLLLWAKDDGIVPYAKSQV